MKVVINRCFGGFCLSRKAYEFLGEKWDGYGFKWNDEEDRTDENLVKCVETLGEEADGWVAKLKVVEVPDNVEWFIDDYDGVETIREKHRTWE